MEVKARLAEEINLFLDPFREKRNELVARPKILEEALQKGTEKMRSLAKATMEEVHDCLGLSRKWRAILASSK